MSKICAESITDDDQREMHAGWQKCVREHSAWLWCHAERCMPT